MAFNKFLLLEIMREFHNVDVYEIQYQKKEQFLQQQRNVLKFL